MLSLIAVLSIVCVLEGPARDRYCYEAGVSTVPDVYTYGVDIGPGSGK